MEIHITRREVLNNLIRLKDNLLVNHENEPVSHKRVYTALLNRHTGDIRFARGVEVLRRETPADWEEIHLVAEDGKEAAHFHLTGAEGKSLRPTNLDPAAVRILFETLDVLNQLAALYHAEAETLPEITALTHLADLHIAPVQEPIDSAKGWAGRLSRLEAEKKLSGHPLGDYLLRSGDGLTERVALSFSRANDMQVKVYILTFVGEGGKISDRLLMQTQWGWTICRDESDLSSPLYEYHATLESLLLSMGNQLTNPI